MYIIIERKHCLVIDPFIDANLFKQLIKKGISFDAVILTHEHYDHISGVNFVREKYSCKVISSKICADNLGDIKLNFSHYFDVYARMQTWCNKTEQQYTSVSCYKCKADLTFTNTFNTFWHDHSLEMFETPGHSMGSIAIMLDGQYMFSGDSLLADYPTTTRTLGGSERDLREITFPIFRALQKRVIVCPGHFAPFYLHNYKYW